MTWGTGVWGTSPWGLLPLGVGPIIIPISPAPGATNVPLDTPLRFLVADVSTNIDLANTTVTIAYQTAGGGWVSQTVYNAGAFGAAWVANSSTAAYAGVYGNGYVFECARSFGTPAVIGAWFGGNDALHEIEVTTQDLDAVPNSANLSWQITTVDAFYITSLEQIHSGLIRASFSNQVADMTEAPNNGHPSALSIWSLSEADYIRKQAQYLGLMMAPGAEFKPINSVTIKRTSRGNNLYPNQLLVYTTPLVEGESYMVYPGSYDWVEYYLDPVNWTTSASDLTDIYGQQLTLTANLLPASRTKTDDIRSRLRGAFFDTSEQSNVAGIAEAIGNAADEQAGSGTRRLVEF